MLDMARIPLKAVLILIILSLCLYSHYEYGKRHSSVDEIKKDPVRYENVSFRSEGTIRDLNPKNGTFTLLTMGDEITAVYGGGKELMEGQYVIVYGTLYSERAYLDVNKIHVYRDTRRLYALSFVGLGAILVLFLREWKPDLSSMEWRRRNA